MAQFSGCRFKCFFTACFHCHFRTSFQDADFRPVLRVSGEDIRRVSLADLNLVRHEKAANAIVERQTGWAEFHLLAKIIQAGFFFGGLFASSAFWIGLLLLPLTVYRGVRFRVSVLARFALPSPSKPRWLLQASHTSPSPRQALHANP